MSLCHKPILSILKALLLNSNVQIIELCLVLLSYIIKEFCSPTSAHLRADPFDEEIHRLLIDFMPHLISIAADPAFPPAVLKAAFCCLSHYSNTIPISPSNQLLLLSTVNRLLHQYSPPSNTDTGLLNYMCLTLQRHFQETTKVAVFVDASLICSCWFLRVLSRQLSSCSLRRITSWFSRFSRLSTTSWRSTTSRPFRSTSQEFHWFKEVMCSMF